MRILYKYGLVLSSILVGWWFIGCSQDNSSSGGEAPAPRERPAEPDVDSGTESPTPAASTSQTEESTETGEVNLLSAVRTEIIASSAFRANQEQVTRLADGDLESAWNSDSGDLEGAWLAIKLPAGVRVNGIEMTSGFTKASDNRDLFTGNYRVRRVRVVRDGESLGEHQLDISSRELQRLPVSGGGGTYRIDFIDMMAGSQESWREACVSEVRVIGTVGEATASTMGPVYRLATSEERAAATASQGRLAPAGTADAGTEAGEETDVEDETEAELASTEAPAEQGPPPATMNDAEGLRMSVLST